jgi:hypothetical protein
MKLAVQDLGDRRIDLGKRGGLEVVGELGQIISFGRRAGG